MPPSSRNQSSRREYADIRGSGYVTHDDYPNEHRQTERHTPRAPHASHRGYHPHVSSENREPRNNPLNGRRITVTSYRIPTQGGFMTSYHESTISYQEPTASYHQSTTSYHIPSTSYHDHRGYFDSHRSSSGYREPLSNLNAEDERNFSARGKYHRSRSNDRREEDAKGNRTDRHHWHRDQRPDQEKPKEPKEEDAKGNRTDRHHGHRDQKPNQEKPKEPKEEDAKGNRTDRHHGHRDQKPNQEKPKEPKATYTDGYSTKSESHRNRRYTTNNSPGQGKRESDSSQRPNKPHSSRNDNRGKENPGSNRSDPFNKDHGKKSRQDIPQSRAKEELPDLYGILRIGPLATEDEIRSAAKRRRIESHPDKLKRPGMSALEFAKIDDEAAKVGEAADILQNPKQKLEYDRKLNAANH